MGINFQRRETGLRVLSGEDELPLPQWKLIEEFIVSRVWWSDDLTLPEDALDPLVAPSISYGNFLLSFDFHTSTEIPQLIEINTNAGGFATYLRMASDEDEFKLGVKKFISALIQEYQDSGVEKILRNIVIVDDNVQEQKLYPEMLWFAELMRDAGFSAAVVTPEEFSWDGNVLTFNGTEIDLVYNRLTDFRLHDFAHRSLRDAAIAKKIVLTPHPAVYARIADKRHLLRLHSSLVPEMHTLGDRSVEDWMRERARWVFKPPAQAGSKGVYRGDKISAHKLKTLPPETLVQLYVPPARDLDGTKFDIRVFAHDNKILGVVARHFSGQVMEMRSPSAGWRRVKIGAE